MMSSYKGEDMKYLTMIVLAFSLTACDVQKTETKAQVTQEQPEQDKSGEIGITSSGNAGLHITDNLCVNFTTGQTEVCF